MERLSPAIRKDGQVHQRVPALGVGILDVYTTPMKKDLGGLAVFLEDLNSDATFEPKCAEAWELYRALIEDLWVGQNLPLREVRNRMRDLHNFKASEKQLRDHTHKWNLRKYRRLRDRERGTGRHRYRDRDDSGSPGSPLVEDHPKSRTNRGKIGMTPAYVPQPTQPARPARQHHDAVLQLLRPTIRVTPFHRTAFDRLVECGLIGMSDYVYGHSEQHEEWKKTTKFDVVKQGQFFQSFNLVGAALASYHKEDHETFGVFIREAFRRVEVNLHSVNPGFVVEVLLHVPYLLLSHGPQDVLYHYVYHLACYAHVSLRRHPIYNTVVAIASALHRDDGFEQLRNWICTAAKLWEDLFANLRGQMDRNVINARSERFYISGHADQQSVRELVTHCTQLRDEAAFEFGPAHIQTLKLEQKMLAVQDASNIYLDDFPYRGEELLQRLEALRTQLGPDEWTYEYWDVYRRVYRYMACYWTAHDGSWNGGVPYLEKCLEGDFPDEASRVWVLKVLDELEMSYAGLGLAEKEDGIRRRRGEICQSIKEEISHICSSVS